MPRTAVARKTPQLLAKKLTLPPLTPRGELALTKNQIITLDAGAANPVTIKCIELNGAGVYSPTGSDENAKSVVLKVSYGAFDEVIAGDLTGSTTQGNDVETTVGPLVGDVEVYKVHHHGSTYSTNDNWLTATTHRTDHAPQAALLALRAALRGD